MLTLDDFRDEETDELTIPSDPEKFKELQAFCKSHQDAIRQEIFEEIHALIHIPHRKVESEKDELHPEVVNRKNKIAYIKRLMGPPFNGDLRFYVAIEGQKVDVFAWLKKNDEPELLDFF